MKKYYGIDEIISDYNRSSQGHFFDPDTMRFFKSRVTSHFRTLNESQYLFITSEKKCFNDPTRVFNVRLVSITPNTNKYCGYDMNIKTVGESMSYTASRAKTFMKNFTLGEK